MPESPLIARLENVPFSRIPGLVITWLLLRLPESPRWLISQGRMKEAELVIKQIEAYSPPRRGGLAAPKGADGVVSPAEYFGRPDHPGTFRLEAAPYQAGAPRRHPASELLSPTYRERTIIVWTLWATAYFVTNSLNNWMPSLYNTVYRLNLQQALRAASMTNVAQVLVLLVCAFCIDRIGRRNWTTACFVIGGAALAILGFVGAQNVLSVMILGTFSYGIIGSVNAVLYLYTAEIYPTRVRAIGTGLATSWLRLASAVGPAIVGLIVGAEGIRSVFLMFAATSVIGALAALRMIETSARRLEEIAP